MLKFIRLLPLLPLRSAFRTAAAMGQEKKFCSSGTVGGTAEARSNRSPRASASRLYFSQARLPRQFSSVTNTAASVARTASPISPQRNRRQRNLLFGLSFINQTVAISAEETHILAEHDNIVVSVHHHVHSVADGFDHGFAGHGSDSRLQIGRPSWRE